MEGFFQPMHLIVILIIVVIIFGPSKLPALGEGLGKSIREFKKAMNDQNDQSTDATSDSRAESAEKKK